MLTKKNKARLNFTGERMIPEFNKGKEIYYEHIERYLFASQFVKNKRVIDLGCGPGYGSIIMSEHGATFVQGVDNSLETIRYAKELYGNKKTNFRVSDVQKLSIFKSKFDVAVAFEVLEHVVKQEDFLSGIKKNLTASGILCISSPNTNQTDHNNPFHLKELTISGFEKLVKKYFKYTYWYIQSFFFANALLPINNVKRKILKGIQESGIEIPMEVFSNEIRKEKALNIIAVCSDKPIGRINMGAILFQSVDQHRLSHSIERMLDSIKIKKDDRNDVRITNLEDELRKIKDSKFYKLLPLYTKIKNLYKKVIP